MNQGYFPSLPVPIIDAALEHVRKKCKIDLDRDLLTELYWQIRWRKQALIELKKRDRALKISISFRVIRDWILDRRFPQRHPSDQFMRKAYASGLGKIGSEYRKRTQPEFQLKRTELQRIMDHVTLDSDRRQYRFIV